MLDTTIAVPQSPHRNIFNVFPAMLFGMLIFSGASLEWLWPKPNCPYLFHPNVHNWLLLVKITVCRDPHATSSVLVLSDSVDFIFFPKLFNPLLKKKSKFYNISYQIILQIFPQLLKMDNINCFKPICTFHD